MRLLSAHNIYPLIFVVISSVVTACATTANYEAKLNTWIGHSTEELVDAWGYPSKKITAPNGNAVYVYNTAETYRTPAYVSPRYTTVTVRGNTAYATTTGGARYGGQVVRQQCTTWFEVNNNKIVKWRHQGSMCQA